MIAVLLAAFLQAAGGAPRPPVTTIEQGLMTFIDVPQQVVVRTAEEWSALWLRHSPGNSPPTIDFSTMTIAAVFIGSRPSAGYGVKIVGIKPGGTPDGPLVLQYVETEPRPGGIAAQVITTPYHIVAIPKQNGAIRFEKIAEP